ncbi:allantoicase [Actinospica sp.]|jgi:allantoicase|uniref:allantoicase n=1 Tax=Actinospica sp. TaxID=1872142 RepID=UPI002CEC38C7|nr:allantoicase [Actinospica sp.]HWG24389.1 allantoicase [Actinospica sp.]
MTDYSADLDLASRALGGAVVWANDEFFGMRENLVTPAPPTFSPHTFDLKGQVVDGWETRRRRPGAPNVEGRPYDSAIIRLGAPGLIRGVTVDTSFFVGNYPPACSIEAADVPGYPNPRELLAADWVTIVPESKLNGDTQNHFELVDGGLRRKRFTHVRLNNIPDGGIARLRVYGEVLPDPEFTVGVQCDLAAARNGGLVTASSDAFFSPATAALMPGESRVMGDGWETARRRDSGNDWIEVRLIGEGEARVIEIDTANYKGNAPDRIRLRGRAGDSGGNGDSEWFDLIAETRVQPDTLHRFRFDSTRPATHLRLDTYPDGGVARFRVHGVLTARGAAEVRARWTAADE